MLLVFSCRNSSATASNPDSMGCVCKGQRRLDVDTLRAVLPDPSGDRERNVIVFGGGGKRLSVHVGARGDYIEWVRAALES